jgi:hypothetical protein
VSGGSPWARFRQGIRRDFRQGIYKLSPAAPQALHWLINTSKSCFAGLHITQTSSKLILVVNSLWSDFNVMGLRHGLVIVTIRHYQGL